MKKLVLAIIITMSLCLNSVSAISIQELCHYDTYCELSMLGQSILALEIFSVIGLGMLVLYILIAKIRKWKKVSKKETVVFVLLSVFLGLGTVSSLIVNYFSLGELNQCQRVRSCGAQPLKPVIYLYPETKQKVQVRLDYQGEIIADYPKYDKSINGWEVEAFPDSTLLHKGKEYSYLFWEGQSTQPIDWDLNTGFIVEGKNAREFLQEKLSYIGLTPKEYNEFIVYWYPKMMTNKYNLVHFAGKDYEKTAPLTITPKPDSILRVFTVIKPLNEKIEIKEQQLEKFERKGFSVVEWGGEIIK